MGKRKKKLNRSKWIPFEDAKAYVKRAQQELKIDFTVTQYRAWHAVVKPKFIPITPYLVYGPEWISWNDYLGNDRLPVGAQPEKFLPFWEAVRWAQNHCRKNNITTAAGWEEWCAQHYSELPDNIPVKPNTVYREFAPSGSWRIWTGKDIQHMVEAQQANIAIMALCNIDKQPSNIIEVLIASNGFLDLKERVEKRGDLRVIKTFVYEPELANTIQKIFEVKCKHREDMIYYTHNVSDLLFELSNILLIYQPNMIET